MMPIFFIGHGSPMNAILDTEFSRAWSELKETIPKPKAILCISAHWLTHQTSITSNEFPPTIHDFGGFPKELFEVEYPAPGDKEYSLKIADDLKAFQCKPDDSWGLDHGTWSILKHIYPEAEIPVIQLSIKNTTDGRYHFELGKALHYLREQNVLILGSGNLIHNLGLVDWSKMHHPNFGYDWAIRANELFKSLILSREEEKLINYQSLGKDANLAMPTPEHFLPFLYILGASTVDDPVQIFNDQLVMGSLNMTSVRYG